jgi:hypothetical protein
MPGAVTIKCGQSYRDGCSRVTSSSVNPSALQLVINHCSHGSAHRDLTGSALRGPSGEGSCSKARPFAIKAAPCAAEPIPPILLQPLLTPPSAHSTTAPIARRTPSPQLAAARPSRGRLSWLANFAPFPLHPLSTAYAPQRLLARPRPVAPSCTARHYTTSLCT